MPDENYLYRNKSRRAFSAWKEKVKMRLPEMVIAFYNYKGYIPYERHVRLGRIIADISNPFYSLQDDKLNNVDRIGELSLQIVLEIQVEDFFEWFSKTIKN